MIDQQLSDRRLIAVACGANMNFDRLRFISERAELGEDREAMLAVEIPERPGSLRDLCEQLQTPQPHGIQLSDDGWLPGTDLHRRSGEDEQDRNSLSKVSALPGFPCHDLSDNEFAKNHLRHMVGGPTSRPPPDKLRR